MLNKPLTKHYVKKKIDQFKYHNSQLDKIFEIENGERKRKILDSYRTELNYLVYSKLSEISQLLKQINDVVSNEKLENNNKYWPSVFISSGLFEMTEADKEFLISHLKQYSVDVSYEVKESLFEIKFVFDFSENNSFENCRLSKTFYVKYDYEVSSDPFVIFTNSVNPKWYSRNSNLTFITKSSQSQKGLCIQTKVTSFFDIFFANITKIESLTTIDSKRIFDMNQELKKLFKLVSGKFLMLPILNM